MAPQQLIVLLGKVYFEEQKAGLFRGCSNDRIHLELRSFATYTPHSYDPRPVFNHQCLRMQG